MVLVRRFAWAMLGAAIGLAVVLVVFYVLRTALVGTLFAADRGYARDVLVGAVSLVVAFALGLVPGARELESTAARSLLRHDGDLVIPGTATWTHRVRTAAWVAFHLLAGLVVAFCLFGLVPATVVIGLEAALGQSIGSPVPVAQGAAGRSVVVLGCAVAAIILFAAAWPVGALAERLVGRFLGPTAADRLEVALARQRKEAEHTLLARELHDGIGHALTVVSVQAAAGRRVATTRPEQAAAALAAIEEVSRGALAELDALLGVLRDDRSPSPAGGVADVVEQHRRSGLDVAADVDLPPTLPPLLHRTVVRIVTEGLTNARRHGAPGEVRVAVRPTEDEVIVQVSNAVAPGSGPRDGRGGGRGLAGIRERVSLFGGDVEAGVVPRGDGSGDDAGRWLLSVRLPRLTEPAPGAEGARTPRDVRARRSRSGDATTRGARAAGRPEEERNG
ncbi:histidine kinase [Myceligenerans xiligouense]|uniref:histidine kinase n=1 Tax=Myceligenerans xiligouense TaxID=253184 RepID=A0A3N4YQB1_9MICO|nr:histidine kinase [Myceligenerans xiligouense]RPF22803.1 histidine kinase [Myceligenerans xiligouense]